MTRMKKIGFLSFGHWTPSPQSQTRSAADTLLQSIELAVAAEQLGADGAYFRVHHFARQLASPFPLLAAVGAKTSTIEIGTGVAEFGRSSFKAAQVIFHDGVCAARGLATLVCMDLKTRKATPLPEAAIERLSKWKIQGA